MKKRLISVLLVLAMLFAGTIPFVQATGYSGSCGKALTWNLDTDSGELIISGTGEMTDYTYDVCSPWDSHRDSIKTVVVEEGVTHIGNRAFILSENISSVSLPDGLISIGRGAFYDCHSLTNMVLPDGLKTIGIGAFEGCVALESIQIPDSVTAIEKGAFSSNYALKSIILPKGLTRIEDCTFLGCKYLESVSIPSSVNYIGEDAFSNCFSLSEVQIPEGVTVLKKGVFAFCFALSDIRLPDTLTTIEEYAFFECSSLKVITIPARVSFIGAKAFYTCENLESVCFLGNAPEVGSSAFRNYNKEPTLYYIAGKAGWTSPKWNTYSAATWDGVNIPHTHSYENSVCTFCGAKIYFRDVADSAWYKDAVTYAVEKNLMSGTGTNIFDPEGSMTRAMLVTVLWRYSGEDQHVYATFADVKEGMWYSKAVSWAAEHNIVNGVDDDKFDPDGKVTREQIATILYRYSKGWGFDVSSSADLSDFPDSGKVSSYAQKALSWAVAEGLITGSKIGDKVYLDPQGNATRAQVATILMRFIENF